MKEPKKFPLDAQIKAVEREIAMRRSVYPKLVAGTRMKPETAAYETSTMEAVLASMKRYRTLRYNLRVLRAGTDGVRHYIDLPNAENFNDAIDALAAKETSG